MSSTTNTRAEQMEIVRRLSRRAQDAADQPIASLMQTALSRPDVISLAAGFVDPATLPIEAMRTSLEGLLDDPATAREALQYGLNAGDLRLRELIAERYFGAEARGLAESMVLTAGSNELLHLVTEVLIDPGDIVLTAAPTYFVYLAALKDCGGHPFGIATDEHGITEEGLAAALQTLQRCGDLERVRALYLVPDFDNPAATTMPTARRRAILDVLEEADLQGDIRLIVDNAYRDLRYEGEDEATFSQLGADPARTIETGTFSKNFSPGVRVGWGVLPPDILTAVLRRKSVIDFGSAHFNQQVLRAVVADGLLDQHVQRLRIGYAKKRDAMDAACRQHLLTLEGASAARPIGGLYQWLRLPPGIDTGPESELWQEAVRQGVLYVPGCYCFPSAGVPVQRETIRLTFGVQPPERIAEGIERLGEAVRSVAARR